ncbi:uncharacterized protein F5147DRAFT_654699 [Suillus discolor]|uniref:Crinkler effector protein N-terminal domain-containing protein n=1 Tax=Suillus discolor TaxID=1912936 RepID=A0A9P7JRV5_9AGAM|nr:uncharacterized protein F5147DRAFT_654699 [Suillus discolor]KAG2103378.1 hypothetical protein F5147DRAFT_654699 [Suillus discolor]
MSRNVVTDIRCCESIHYKREVVEGEWQFANDGLREISFKSNFELTHCFVLDDDPSRMFSVKILETDTVSCLKQVIKKMRNAFHDVDADTLQLWKISRMKLKPLTRLLSEVFTVSPEDEHPHIFVQHVVVQPPPAVGHPSIHLNCLILDDDPSHVFSVKILQTDTVDIDPEKKEKLDLPDDAKELKPPTQLSQVFTVQVGPEDGHLHIVFVQHPANASRDHLQPSSSTLPKTTQQLRAEWIRNFDEFCSKTPPSFVYST